MIIRIKSIKFFALNLLLMISCSLLSMEQENLNLNEELKPFSDKPIAIIPKYVYENVNQYLQYNWSDNTFQTLKGSVGKIKKETLQKKYQDEEAFERTAESYDWIHALNLIQEQYLNKDMSSLTIQDIIDINSRISRFTSENPGIRQNEMMWCLGDWTLAEDLIYHYMDKYMIEVKQNKDQVKLTVKNNEYYFNAENLTDFFNMMVKNQKFRDSKNRNLNINEPYEWAKEQGETDNTISLKKFLEKIRFEFYTPKKIKPELEKLLIYLKNTKDNPIKKAINAWYYIIRIHPFYQAHKRTGKALGSIILLQNGYLPPLITKEYEEEYTNSLISDFKADKGPVEFEIFIIKLIKITQEKYKSDSFILASNNK